MTRAKRPAVGERVLFMQLGTVVRLYRGNPVVKFDRAEEAVCPWNLLTALYSPKRKAKTSKGAQSK